MAVLAPLQCVSGLIPGLGIMRVEFDVGSVLALRDFFWYSGFPLSLKPPFLNLIESGS